MSRPSVKTKCIADNYHGDNERIIEFCSRYGGGLISFRERGGKLMVEICRQDSTVEVMVGKPKETTEAIV